MLSQILDQFREKRVISLSQLAIHFNTDGSAMKGMLDGLEKKGYIKNLNDACTSCSSSCSSCSFASEKDIYMLVDK